MKKVKIMLMAIAVVAVTGGLVAAKVKRNDAFCTVATVGSGVCPTTISSPAIITGKTLGGTEIFCTASLTGPNSCPTSASSYATTSLTTD
jgi:hypothetical protein